MKRTAAASMLSRSLKRALLDSPSSLPPTFLLPWAAGLSTVSHTPDASIAPPPPLTPTSATPTSSSTPAPIRTPKAALAIEPQVPPELSPPTTAASSPAPALLSPSVRELLPLLRSQSQHYITAHIHGNPYLLTEGDTVRLPFFMKGVEPGDVLRLNRAINLGSRDYTLKAPAPAAKLTSPATRTTSILDPTTGSLASHSRIMPTDSSAASPTTLRAPHFIPHIAQGRTAYIDDRLFVCRAVVMGVENEAMRIKEKTKRRQRHIRKVKSKHRHTILKIKELRIRSVEDVEGDVD